MSEKTDFGIFNDFWNGHPNHLPFLNLYEIPNPSKDWNLNMSLTRLKNIISKNSSSAIVEGVRLLLKNDDWRPHLVAVLATLKIDEYHQAELKPDLWNRLKYGSWVSPQILVILSIIDHEFNAKAKEICENGFKVTYFKKLTHEEYSAKGPASVSVDNKKVVASCEYLLNGIITDSWENDNGGSLAKDWKRNLMELIENYRF